MAGGFADSGKHHAPGRALANFVGTAYGAEYLTLQLGELIEMLQPRAEDGGWAYGMRMRDGARGWFPASYWRPASPSPPSSSSSSMRSRPDCPVFGPEKAARSPSLPQGTFQNASIAELAALAANEQAAEAAKMRGRWRDGTDQVEKPSEARGVVGEISSGDGGGSTCDAPEPCAKRYSRESLLALGIALIESEAHDRREVRKGDLTVASIEAQTTCSSPAADAPAQKREQAPEVGETLAKLVEVAGGKCRVGNLAAACIALGVIAGNHREVNRVIVATASARSDLFAAMPEVPPNDSSKSVVSLRS
mmetsp:Transcript_111160/g.313679  ORF Transcript_111160/g.313679 Transcript_111160/m.313679 type:complete len:307 (+) Transcript_111160:70-990(+)